jgi:hypothetical protein
LTFFVVGSLVPPWINNKWERLLLEDIEMTRKIRVSGVIFFPGVGKLSFWGAFDKNLTEVSCIYG